MSAVVEEPKKLSLRACMHSYLCACVCAYVSVCALADPEVRQGDHINPGGLGGHINPSIRLGGNLIRFSVSHAYLFVGGGVKSIAKLVVVAMAGLSLWIRDCVRVHVTTCLHHVSIHI